MRSSIIQIPKEIQNNASFSKENPYLETPMRRNSCPSKNDNNESAIKKFSTTGRKNLDLTANAGNQQKGDDKVNINSIFQVPLSKRVHLLADIYRCSKPVHRLW